MVLTAVAFAFVVSGNLPRISYSTRLDKLVNIMYLLLFCNTAENLVVYHMGESWNMDSDAQWTLDLLSFFILVFVVIFSHVWFMLPCCRERRIGDPAKMGHSTVDRLDKQSAEQFDKKTGRRAALDQRTNQ